MTSSKLTPTRYERLPIFPLTQVHLFPETHLPLHIFEPRYRQMVRDSLNGDRLLGIILPSFNADPHEYEPDLVKIGGVGKIEEHQSYEDGRFNVILRGIEKFELLGELKESDILYRVVRAQGIVDSVELSCTEELLRHELFSAFHLYFTHFSSGKLLSLSEELPLERLVNLVASSLRVSTREKQALFELNSVEERALRILKVLYESTKTPQFLEQLSKWKPGYQSLN